MSQLLLAAGCQGSAPLSNCRDYLIIYHFEGQTSWLHGFMSAYANSLGIAVFALVLLAGWWIARRRREPRAMAAALWAGIGMVIAVGINVAVSNAIAEPRPFVTLRQVMPLVAHAADPSLPSDHAAFAGAIAAGAWLVSRRLGALATALALLLAFARVYTGVHYPGDVLAGLGLGAFVVWVGWFLVRPLLRWLVERLTRTPLRPLLTAAPG